MICKDANRNHAPNIVFAKKNYILRLCIIFEKKKNLDEGGGWILKREKKKEYHGVI